MQLNNESCENVVSFDSELLVLVDDNDDEIGHLPKAEAHRGAGHLHRAFSLFVFDDRDRLLIQRRASSKRLWPGYWSNTCCSHPRRGESMETAVSRRLREELTMRCSMEFLFKFQYRAQYDVEAAEHELCWVFAGRSNDTPQPNRSEISDLRYVGKAELDREILRAPRTFTPWFKLEWARVREGLRSRGHPTEELPAGPLSASA